MFPNPFQFEGAKPSPCNRAHRLRNRLRAPTRSPGTAGECRLCWLMRESVASPEALPPVKSLLGWSHFGGETHTHTPSALPGKNRGCFATAPRVLSGSSAQTFPTGGMSAKNCSLRPPLKINRTEEATSETPSDAVLLILPKAKLGIAFWTELPNCIFWVMQNHVFVIRIGGGWEERLPHAFQSMCFCQKGHARHALRSFNVTATRMHVSETAVTAHPKESRPITNVHGHVFPSRSRLASFQELCEGRSRGSEMVSFSKQDGAGE